MSLTNFALNLVNKYDRRDQKLARESDPIFRHALERDPTTRELHKMYLQSLNKHDHHHHHDHHDHDKHDSKDLVGQSPPRLQQPIWQPTRMPVYQPVRYTPQITNFNRFAPIPVVADSVPAPSPPDPEPKASKSDSKSKPVKTKDFEVKPLFNASLGQSISRLSNVKKMEKLMTHLQTSLGHGSDDEFSIKKKTKNGVEIQFQVWIDDDGDRNFRIKFKNKKGEEVEQRIQYEGTSDKIKEFRVERESKKDKTEAEQRIKFKNGTVSEIKVERKDANGDKHEERVRLDDDGDPSHKVKHTKKKKDDDDDDD